jgi:hypothetical protein
MKIRGRRLIPVTLAAIALGAATAVPLVPVSASPATAPTGCTAEHVKVHLGHSDGTAGTTYQKVRFRNTGASACILDGYPRFIYLNRAGDRIGFPAKPDGPHHAVTIEPGHVGVAALGIPDYLNFPRARCHPRHAVKLGVTAPGTTQRQQLKLKVTVCTTRFGRSFSLAVRHHF